VIQGAVLLGEKPALLTGLSPLNQRKLLDGRPLRLDGAPFGVPGAYGFLFAGADHEELCARFAAQGVPSGPVPQGLDPAQALRLEALGKAGQLIMIIGLTSASIAALAMGEHFILTGGDMGQPHNRFILAGLLTEEPRAEELAAMIAAYPVAGSRRHVHRPTDLERQGLRLTEVLDNRRVLQGYAITRDDIPVAYRAARAGTGFCDCVAPPPQV
jgi:hypothetical protein